jgi:hypothetical protein
MASSKLPQHGNLIDCGFNLPAQQLMWLFLTSSSQPQHWQNPTTKLIEASPINAA